MKCLSVSQLMAFYTYYCNTHTTDEIQYFCLPPHTQTMATTFGGSGFSGFSADVLASIPTKYTGNHINYCNANNVGQECKEEN